MKVRYNYLSDLMHHVPCAAGPTLHRGQRRVGRALNVPASQTFELEMFVPVLTGGVT